MSKKVFAVMGATGHIGHVLTEELLKKGHAVRALGRDPQKLSKLKSLGAETFSPDLEDAKALAKAFKGAEGVFTLIPPNYGEPDFSTYQDRAGEAIVSAVLESGVQAVMDLSSVGAGEPVGTGPITGLYRQEQRLNKFTSVHLLHLRPTAFMENQYFAMPVIKSMGINGSPVPNDYPMHVVATKDIGVKAAEFFEKGFTGHQVFEFTGPREYANNEITAALGIAIGKPDLKYVQFSYDDAKKGMLGSGMLPKMADLMVEMYRAGNEGKIHPTQELTAEHRGPTTIEEFAKGFAVLFAQN